jgi:hypothetical protein
LVEEHVSIGEIYRGNYNRDIIWLRETNRVKKIGIDVNFSG